MKMMRGDVESWSNSVEVASLVWVMEIDQTQVSSVIPKRERQRNSVTEGKDILKGINGVPLILHTFLAYSITASWNPRHIPR